MTPLQFEEKLNDIIDKLPGSIPYNFNYKLTVKKADEGKTFLDFYAQKFHRKTKDYWFNKINSQEILINGKPQPSEYKLKAGEITDRTEKNIVEPPVSTNIQLVYCDNYILVVNKPSPLPTQASGRFIKNTLHYILELVFDGKKIFPIHRLDANTTGLVVFTWDKNSAKSLIEQFQLKAIKKTYLALVENILDTTTTVKKSISKEISSSGSRTVSEGKNSTTHIKTLKTRENTTLLSLQPETGRTNQIRLHLASIGHPIVGDIGYKDPLFFKNNPLTYPTDQLYLHAWKIIFIHPNTCKEISLTTNTPLKFEIN